MTARIGIIGGGITGLAAAWELQQQGLDYIVLEAAERLGGKILTERVDGFIIEGAADSFLAQQKPWAWQLCRELGLGDELIASPDQPRNVYVLKDGRLQLMPRGLRLIVPTDRAGLMDSGLLSEEGKRQMLAEPEAPPRTTTEDESLASFIRRRFGQEALEVFGEPLLAGIYTGDPESLSMRATFPNYLALERKYGSVTRGMQSIRPPAPSPNMPNSTFVALPNGTGQLIETLAAKLTGEIRTGQAVTRIEAGAGNSAVLHTANGETFAVDAVILTTPVYVAKSLLVEVAPELADALGAVRAISSATVSLGYRWEQVEHPLDATGFVVASTEPTHLLASTWSSSKWPSRAPQGYVLLRAFFGGHRCQSDVDLPDDELVKMAHTELGRLLDIKGEPVISRVFRWRNANTQYEVGHLDLVARFRALCPPWLYLTGAPYEGVGIPDCVRQGRHTAQKVKSEVRSQKSEV